MSKIISIDPGKFKCGLIFADLTEKKVYQALVIKSNLLRQYVKNLLEKQSNLQLMIGNGTSSEEYIKSLNDLFPDLIIAEEKNTTFRAKQRYFEIFPIKGIKRLVPREFFILNKNLDAISALIIIEDYYKFKFDISEIIGSKTWLK